MSVSSMSMQKRKKNYFSSSSGNQKRRKQPSLEPGMSGFLCTSNFREKDCVRDAYKILNEFADLLYGQEFAKGKDKEKDRADEAAEPAEDDEDISTALSKEISELKAEYAKPISARRFQVVDTGVKNVVFIKTTLPEPLELATKIITELDKTKEQRTRYLLRLVPVEMICKAYMDDIKTKADLLFDKYFTKAPKTFCIVFSRRNNNSIHRNEIIEELARMVLAKNSENKADLQKPEIAVLVQVIRGICLLSVAPHYYTYKKYNLLELCNVKTAQETREGESEKEGAAVDGTEDEQDREVEDKEDKDLVEEEEEKEEESNGVEEPKQDAETEEKQEQKVEEKDAADEIEEAKEAVEKTQEGK